MVVQFKLNQLPAVWSSSKSLLGEDKKGGAKELSEETVENSSSNKKQGENVEGKLDSSSDAI